MNRRNQRQKGDFYVGRSQRDARFAANYGVCCTGSASLSDAPRHMEQISNIPLRGTFMGG
jgi:hypothetical protein